jgi:Ca2+-transporting ATPase
MPFTVESPYRLPAAEVVATLGSNAQQGLSDAEAQNRLKAVGYNELEAEEPTPTWRKFLAQFQDTLVILLLIAVGVSVALWFYERESALPYEGIAIFSIVLLNAILGYVQEARAEQAVAALRAMSAAEAQVIRGGQRKRVPARDLVPGDIILIEEGDTLPADGRLLQSTALQAAEASLTGESLPVSKDTNPINEDVGVGDRHNMVFSGTAATYGRGTAIITATAMNSELGKIAGLLQNAPTEVTPLQQELDRTGRLLGGIVLAIAAIVVVTIILVEGIRDLEGIVDILIFGVALAVAAVPEGLPAIVTAVLALGVQRMAKRNAIVRKLPAVETLGSANVIASDKTGTLTKNEMTVRTIVTTSGRVAVTGTGYTPEGEIQPDTVAEEAALQEELTRILRAADLANNAALQEKDGRWTVIGDPTEGALLVAAKKAGLEQSDLEEKFKRVGEVPFSSERKIMSTVHHDAAKQERLIVFSKGAPDVLLERCSHELVGDQSRPLTDERRAEWRTLNEGLAEEALRTLGVSFRSLPHDALSDHSPADDTVEHDFVFLGLIGMIDPPREEVKAAVATAHGAGIRTLMITGDHPKTAAAIATELGISDKHEAVTGAELVKMDAATLDQTVATNSVYARVNPEHKLQIVESLQRQGSVVAMTGDGVNDAPALKRANIGVAMGITGTDVSKEAADMVLLDDNFATIVAAVEEGRSVFSNIQKFLRYLLSSNLGEVFTMFFGVLLAPVIGLVGAGEGSVILPLLATQILWINLVTDGPPALALGVEPPSPRTMNRPPRSQGSGVITRQMWIGIVFVGIVMAIGTLFVLDASLPGGLIPGTGNLDYARTMAFTTLMLFQLFNVFNARSDETSAFNNLFSNPLLWGAVGLSLFLHILVVYLPPLQAAFATVPLSLMDWVLCVIPASTVIVAREIMKWVIRRRTA